MRCRFLLVTLVFCFALTAFAQNRYTMYFEPGIDLSYDVSPRYAHGFSVENRNVIHRDSKFDYLVKHIELAHISAYTMGENKTVALGVKYRFRESFEAADENELRWLQALKWTTEKPHIGIKQEVRAEQRFYPSTTKHRMRYELGLVFPLNRSKANNYGAHKNAVYIKAEAGALLEIAKTQKPEFEQRMGSVLGWQLSPKNSLEIGLQYRLADYTQNLGHELFLVTGINVGL